MRVDCKHTWRVNYGNGQVNYHEDRESSFRELASLTQYREFAYIENYAGWGEWKRVRPTRWDSGQ